MAGALSQAPILIFETVFHFSVIEKMNTASTVHVAPLSVASSRFPQQQQVVVGWGASSPTPPAAKRLNLRNASALTCSAQYALKSLLSQEPIQRSLFHDSTASASHQS